MSKPRNQPGAVVPLAWDGDPDFIYVYGHVTEDEFVAEMNAYYDVDDVTYGPMPSLSEKPLHMWARYVLDGSSLDGARRVLKSYRSQGRGTFAVTGASVSWVHHPRCKEWAGDRPCWIRTGHQGPHMSHTEWLDRRGKQ